MSHPFNGGTARATRGGGSLVLLSPPSGGAVSYLILCFLCPCDGYRHVTVCIRPLVCNLIARRMLVSCHVLCCAFGGVRPRPVWSGLVRSGPAWSGLADAESGVQL